MMNMLEFINYIERIGFIYNKKYDGYYLNEYILYVNNDFYEIIFDFGKGDYYAFYMNDVKIIDNILKDIRKNKLNKILNKL